MPEDLPISITVGAHERWTVMSVVGDLDMATAPLLEKSAGEIDGSLAIEVSGVRFIDSSGLRALFYINETTDQVVLVSPSAFVKRILDLTAMTQVFAVAEDIEALTDPA